MRKFALLPMLAGCMLMTVVACANQSTQSVSNRDLTISSVSTGNSVSTANNQQTKNSTTTSLSQSQLASMSPQQLFQTAQKSGTLLPFAGKDITRRFLTQQLTANNPSSGSAFPNSFGNGNFYVVDQWAGTILGKAFKLEVDMKPDGTECVIGMTGGTTTAAVLLEKQPWITNLTGSYVVFASPNPTQGNHMYAINLTTGDIIKDSNLARHLSGMTGNSGYPTHIVGLNKSYAVFPNGRNSYRTNGARTEEERSSLGASIFNVKVVAALQVMGRIVE